MTALFKRQGLERQLRGQEHRWISRGPKFGSQHTGHSDDPTARSAASGLLRQRNSPAHAYTLGPGIKCEGKKLLRTTKLLKAVLNEPYYISCPAPTFRSVTQENKANPSHPLFSTLSSCLVPRSQLQSPLPPHSHERRAWSFCKVHTTWQRSPLPQACLPQRPGPPEKLPEEGERSIVLHIIYFRFP